MRETRVRGGAVGAFVVAALFALTLSACAPPPSQATSSPSQATSSSSDPLASGVLAAMNRDRAANGVAPLAWNAHLGDVAASWSTHLADVGSLAHQDIAAVGASAENLFWSDGDASAATIEATWMGSSLHRANLLSPSLHSVGIGYTRRSDGQLFVVADFGA